MNRARIAALAALVARWVLGGMFLYTGVVKAVDPVEFLKLAREFGIVGSPAGLNLIAAALPWFEVFCGLLLLSGVAVRGTALAVLVLLIPLSAMVLRRALAVQDAAALPFCAVRFDCGCGLGEVAVCQKLAENGLLIGLAAFLVFSRDSLLSLRHRWL